MIEPTKDKPVAVPETAKRAGEILLRWGWVESSVWTERMLTALDEGVKGGKWFGCNPSPALLTSLSDNALRR